MSYLPIENHGVIGDLHTVALVGMDGSIDFMCLPQFDSPLGLRRAARRSARRPLPAGPGARRRAREAALPARHRRAAHPLSRRRRRRRGLRLHAGRDAGRGHTVVRRAKTVRGEVRFRMVCAAAVRLRAGRATRSSGRADGVLFRLRGRPGVALRLRGVGAAAARTAARPWREFTLRRGRVGIVRPRAGVARPRHAVGGDRLRGDGFKETVNFWRRWVGRSSYRGRWREMVNRSALTLKLLTSRTHGSIVAVAHLRSPRGGRRAAQLGLPLHLDPRRLVHALRAHAPRLHRGGGRLHALGRGALRGARARTARCRSCTASTAATSSPRRSLPHLEATWAHRPCGSATPPTVTCSSTSTAS